MNTTSTSQNGFTLAIDGMSCGHCVQAVTKALAEVPSVKVRSVTVGAAEIEAAGPEAAKDAVNALSKAGYAARVAARADQNRGGGCCCGGPKGCSG